MSGIASSSSTNRYNASDFSRNTTNACHEDANGIDYVIANYDSMINDLGDYPAKHIINALSQIAEDVTLANHIVPYLEDKILRVSPRRKLPIFYLMDYIIKNIGNPYLMYFGRNISRIFCQCIDQVPLADVRKFEHVLNTWIERRLFPQDQLANMRNKIMEGPKPMEASPPPFTAGGSASGLGVDSVQKLMYTNDSTHSYPRPTMYPRRNMADQWRMQNTMPIDPRRQRNNPMNSQYGGRHAPPPPLPQTQSHQQAQQAQAQSHQQQAQSHQQQAQSHQQHQHQHQHQQPSHHQHQQQGFVMDNRGLVRGRVLPLHAQNRSNTHATAPGLLGTPDDNELRRLLAQLQTEQNIPQDQHLSLEEVKHKNPPFYKQLLDYQTLNPSSQTGMRSNEHIAKRKQQTQSGLHAQHIQEKRPRSTNSNVSSQAMHLAQLVEKQHNVTSLPIQPPTIDPTRVGDILKRLQGISEAGHSTAGGNTNSTSVPSIQPPQPPQPPSSSTDSTSLKIAPSKERIEANVKALYGDLQFVSRQSGVRFKTQEMLYTHLDFVFQYNRSQREKAKGTTSRSWYPTEDQWETDFQDTSSCRGETNISFFDTQSNQTDPNDENNSTAAVPADEQNTKCRICGETFTKFWDEEEEEWMYRNAVFGVIHSDVDGESNLRSIFHKHCYEAATTNSSTVSVNQLAPGTPQSPTVPTRTWQDTLDAPPPPQSSLENETVVGSPISQEVEVHLDRE